MNVPQEDVSRFGIASVDAGHKITHFAKKQKQSDSTLASMGIYVSIQNSLNQLEEDAQDKTPLTTLAGNHP
jgi:ADP-glucose pyrophosphorylase